MRATAARWWRGLLGRVLVRTALPESPCNRHPWSRSRSRKVPRGLKPQGFPDDPSPRIRGGIQAWSTPVQASLLAACAASLDGACVVSILRSPRLVSWGSSPGVPDPWYWLTFYAGSLPVPASAYVRRLDRTGNGPVIKDRLFLSTFAAASSTALERAWHPPRFIGDPTRTPRWPGRWRSPSRVRARGLSPDTGLPTSSPVWAKGSDRTAVSSRHHQHSPLSLRCVSQAGVDVIGRQVGKVVQDLAL